MVDQTMTPITRPRVSNRSNPFVFEHPHLRSMQHQESRLRVTLLIAEIEQTPTALDVLPVANLLVEILTGLEDAENDRVTDARNSLPSWEGIHCASAVEVHDTSRLFVEQNRSSPRRYTQREEIINDPEGRLTLEHSNSKRLRMQHFKTEFSLGLSFCRSCRKIFFHPMFALNDSFFLRHGSAVRYLSS